MAQAIRRKETLKATAKETLNVLPALLARLRRTEAASSSTKYSTLTMRRLDPNHCPSYSQPATIKVINEDTLNAAIQLSNLIQSSGDDPQLNNPRPLIISFANDQKPGGGWLNGQIAQEEAICYRSSLARSLHHRHYPLAWDEVIYSPYVLVVREDMAQGHRLYRGSTETLPVVSCLTVAALRKPKVHTFVPNGASYGLRARLPEKQVFESDKDRSITKAKMRLTLRTAAVRGHHSLVLGALGCGIYANPPEDVAHCWLEVLREDEFAGNWWREICFAVYDPKNEGNYEVFNKVLSGKQV